jgi:hypothetical protein
MIEYFNISVPWPRKPPIHNMLSIRGFHMHEHFGNFRMFFTHATFYRSRDGMPNLNQDLGIDLQV